MAVGEGVRRMVAVLATACLLGVLAAPRADAARHGGPRVGRERPVSDPVLGPVAGSPVGADIASDGTNYFVVWTEGRSQSSGYDVFGARVTAQGEVLDPTGIRIASAYGTQEQPRVAFGDGHYLVVWAGFEPNQLSDVQGARVSPEGVLLDPVPLAISTDPGGQYDPAVAYGDGTFLVTWSDTRVASWTYEVYGARVTDAGVVLDPEGIPISTASESHGWPRVAFGDGNFLVVWGDDRTVGTAGLYGARVDVAGAVLDPDGLPIDVSPGSRGGHDVAFNGSNYLVTWTMNESPDPNSGVQALRVDPTGAVLDPEPIIVASSEGGGFGHPVVTALGPVFLVVWLSGSWQADAFGVRVEGDGTVLDPTPFPISSQPGRWGGIVAASNGSGYFAALNDERAGRLQLYGNSISPDGSTIGPATLISRAAGAQRDSDIAFDGRNHLIVWAERQSDWGEQSYATLMAPSGRWLRSGFPVGARAPEVVFDGDFVIGSMSETNVILTRVSTSGDVVGTPVQLPSPPGNLVAFDIAASDDGILVTWADRMYREQTVRAMRVARDGTVLDPVPIVLGPGGGMKVASDGRDFVVSWLQFGGPGPGLGGSVRASRITAEGTLLDPTGIEVTTGPDFFGTEVAWNGRRYLVVWTGSIGAPGDGELDVLGARVTAGGVVEDAIPLAIGAGPLNQREPEVAANGAGTFLVAWRETDERALHDVRGARVADDGRVLDRPRFPIAASGEPETGPAVSPGRGLRWGVTYSRFVPESGYSADRVFFRKVSPK